MKRKNSYNKTLGRSGENLAANYLTSKGYKIIARNFKNKYCEIDIVAQDGRILVFVEVKTRRSDRFGQPEEAINSRKIKSLIKGAYIYNLKNPKDPDRIRIDLIAVKLSTEGKTQSIRHYKNITQ